MAQQQINIRVDDDLAAEVDKAMQEAGYKSRNEVASEILELYLPIWRELKRRQKAIFQEQVNSLLEKPPGRSRRAG